MRKCFLPAKHCMKAIPAVKLVRKKMHDATHALLLIDLGGCGRSYIPECDRVRLSHTLSATEMLRQIHSGEKTCAEHVTALYERIRVANGAVNACVEVFDREKVLASAQAVDAKVAKKEKLLPLEGHGERSRS